MGRKSRLKKSAGEKQQRSAAIRVEPGSSILLKPIVPLLFVILVGVISYSNTLHSPFQWDDYGLWLKDNPVIKDLHYFIEPSKAEVFVQYGALKSRYIGFLTFALNYRFHGFDVTGYHIVNLCIHIVNAILVYFLVLLTFRTPHFRAQNEGPAIRYMISRDSRFAIMTSFFASTLFVAHPVQTEAVTYVFQRLASLVTMFYLLTIILYTKARLLGENAEANRQNTSGPEGGTHRNTGPRAVVLYLLSVFSAILAMKTKENAFTLPFMIMLYEFLFFLGPVKGRILRLIPWLLTLFIIPLTLSGSEQSAAGMMQDPTYLDYRSLTIARTDYLFTQFRVIVTYVRLLFFPANQNVDYAYPIYHSFFAPAVIASFFFLLFILGTGILLIYLSSTERFRKEKRDEPGLSVSRLVGFGIVWFFVALSVESSIIPIPMIIDEYRVYLPSVGALTAMAAGAGKLVEMLRKKKTIAGKAGVTAVLLLAVTLAVATYRRNEVWSGVGTLWEDAVVKSPGKSRPHYNLGVFYQSQGRLDEAVREYQTVVRLAPGYTEAHNNLGRLYEISGRLGEALKEYQTAMELDSGSATIRNNLGYLYVKLKRPDEAKTEFQAALKINPNMPQAHNGLGDVYDAQGHTEEAMGEYRAALKLNPLFINAHDSLGTIYFKLERLDDALGEFKTVSRLFNSGNANAHCNIGTVYFKQGHLTEALEEYRMALRLDPNSALARQNLELLSKEMIKRRHNG